METIGEMKMDNFKEHVCIELGEYRELLTQAANYAMLQEVIKAGVKLGYAGELTIGQATIDVVLKYILGGAYDATIDALKED